MPGDNIVDLEGLLKQYIGENKEIIDIKKERLTSPGENYCSIMLKLDITVRNLQTGKEEEINAVAKTVNTEVNEFFKQAAHPQFKKEIAFYTEIVPALQQFQREQGVDEVLDLFPKVYAARKNIHGNDDEIDDDSVIIMENLKVQGYCMIDRVTGFDLEGAKLILRDLAQLHAVPLALKIKKPEVFDDKVKKYCEVKPFTLSVKNKPQRPKWIEYLFQEEKCKPYLEDLSKCLGNLGKGDFFARPYVEPFASLAHCDMWVNNTMQTKKNGLLIKNKFVDFQLYQYGSTICDVVFFIFASCQNYISRDHFDDLLKYYHTQFIDVLENLGCDTTPFEYSKFLERLDIEAPAELVHTLCLAVPIQGKRGEANINVEGDNIEKEGSLTEETKEKMLHEVCEFGKKGWIK